MVETAFGELVRLGYQVQKKIVKLKSPPNYFDIYSFPLSDDNGNLPYLAEIDNPNSRLMQTANDLKSQGCFIGIEDPLRLVRRAMVKTGLVTDESRKSDEPVQSS